MSQGSDSELERLACQVVAQLPSDYRAAVRVLDISKNILNGLLASRNAVKPPKIRLVEDHH